MNQWTKKTIQFWTITFDRADAVAPSFFLSLVLSSWRSQPTTWRSRLPRRMRVVWHMWKEASVHSLRLRMLSQVRGDSISSFFSLKSASINLSGRHPPVCFLSWLKWLIWMVWEKSQPPATATPANYNRASSASAGSAQLSPVTHTSGPLNFEMYMHMHRSTRERSELDAQHISRWRRRSAVTLPGTSNQLFAASFILLSVYSRPQSYFPLLFIHSLSASIIIIIAFRMFVSWLGERQCFHC